MKCDFSKEKLLDFFYAELDAVQKQEVEAHLAGCSSCQAELALFRQTSRVLRRWPDEDPNLNLRFVQQKTSVWNSLWEKLWPKFALGFAAGCASVLVVLSLLNVEANYSEGGFKVMFRLFERSQSTSATVDPLDQPITRREFNAWQQTSYDLMQTMIDNAAAQQRYEQRLLLSQFAKDLDLKRRQDLQRLDQGLEVFQLVNENKFRRTNEVLQQLLYAAYSQTSDTNLIENK